MIEWSEISKFAVPVVSAIMAGSGMWSYIAARQNAKTSAPAQVMASQADIIVALNAQTALLLAESAKDRKDLKHRVDRQGAQITRLTRAVNECNEKHASCEVNVAELEAKVARLEAVVPPPMHLG